MVAGSMTERSIGEWIEFIQSKGYLINNLFQCEPDMWRCSLRKPQPDKKEDFYEYGEGGSPELALKVALHNAVVMHKYSYQVARNRVIRDNT